MGMGWCLKGRFSVALSRAEGSKGSAFCLLQSKVYRTWVASASGASQSERRMVSPLIPTSSN